MNSYTFEIKDTVDFFRTFQLLVDDYLKEPLSSVKAVVCAMFAWHLVDWVHQEYPEVSGNFAQLGQFQRALQEQCNSLVFMQDITNGTKHRAITRYEPTVRDAQKEGGAFSPAAFSKGFYVSCLKLTLDDGSVAYFDVEIGKARNFWKAYFKNTLRISV